MVIEGNMFQFYVSPYFLRLGFDGELIEDGRETSKFDPSTSACACARVCVRVCVHVCELCRYPCAGSLLPLFHFLCQRIF